MVRHTTEAISSEVAMQDDLLKRHARRVLAVVGDVDSQLTDTPIARSWLRCIDTYGIDPVQCHQTTVLEHYRLQEHQQRLEEILAIARAEMNNLYHVDSAFVGL